MAETFDEYRARVLGYLGEREPIAVLAKTNAELERALEGVSPAALTARPFPGKWSILEIIAHLADTELAFGWRIRTILATSGAPLAWFNQDKWASALDYNSMDLAPALAQFSVLRAGHLALLRAIPKESWNSRYGVHELRGRQTVTEFVQLEAAHDLNHLLQIERILEGLK